MGHGANKKKIDLHVLEVLTNFFSLSFFLMIDQLLSHE